MSPVPAVLNQVHRRTEALPARGEVPRHVHTPDKYGSRECGRPRVATAAVTWFLGSRAEKNVEDFGREEPLAIGLACPREDPQVDELPDETVGAAVGQVKISLYLPHRERRVRHGVVDESVGRICPQC